MLSFGNFPNSNNSNFNSLDFGFTPNSGFNPTSSGNNLFSNFNFGNLSNVFEGISALGQLYGGFQQNKLAKDSFKMQKEAFRTNLDNQTKVYNTSLEDKIRARYAQEGRNPAEANAYVEKNSL